MKALSVGLVACTLFVCLTISGQLLAFLYLLALIAILIVVAVAK